MDGVLPFLLLPWAVLLRPVAVTCVHCRQAADQALATERQRCSGLAVQLAAAQQQLRHMQVGRVAVQAYVIVGVCVHDWARGCAHGRMTKQACWGLLGHAQPSPRPTYHAFPTGARDAFAAAPASGLLTLE